MAQGTLWRALAETARRWRASWTSDRARRAKRRKGAAEAARVLQLGLEALPGDAQLWNDLAVLQIELRDLASAERSVRRALQINSDLPQAHCNLGIVLAERADDEPALRCLDRALQLDPQLDVAHQNRAMLLSRMQHVEAALAAWDDILQRDPGHAHAYAVKAALLLRSGRYAEAGQHLDRAESLGSRTPAIALYRALIEAAIGDPQRAANAITALRGKMEDAELDWDLAHIYLSRGEFQKGWPLYEARLRKSFDSPRRAYGFPEWQGESLAPGALLVMAEQGLGDEIMFASCYRDVIERAPGCVIECDPRLESLFARSFPGARVVGAARGNDRLWLAEHRELRCQVHAGSLPRFFRTSAESFPRHCGYLRPDPQRVAAWRDRLAPLGGLLKVGIAWNGGLAHTRRSSRCVPLPQLAPLLRGSPHAFISLQHDDDGSEVARLSEMSGTAVHAFGAALRDLDENASLLRALDVVITVCSSVAHMSGAVGVATWVMTPRIPEWRYLRTGTTLPWYPGVRLFRQQEEGAWQPVVSSISAQLAAFRPAQPDQKA